MYDMKDWAADDAAARFRRSCGSGDASGGPLAFSAKKAGSGKARSDVAGIAATSIARQQSKDCERTRIHARASAGPSLRALRDERRGSFDVRTPCRFDEALRPVEARRLDG